MESLITREEIQANRLFFWWYYFSWFRGGDRQKEFNMDQVLEQSLGLDPGDLDKWYQSFFDFDKGDIRYLGGQLEEGLAFQIEFHQAEIVFFINEEYIGNLGGHFEAWTLTLDELRYFQKFDYVFLLLVPMLGISQAELAETKALIQAYLDQIEELKGQSDYIATCITQGLVMEGDFYLDPEVGRVNRQNHSVRNISKYPQYKASLISLNQILAKYTRA